MFKSPLAHKAPNAKSKTAIAVATCALLSGCITINAKSLDYKETKNLQLSSASLKTLEVDAGAGFLTIKGEKGLTEIKVTADIETHDDDFELTLLSSNGKAVLTADINSSHSMSWGDSPKIDLTVTVPQSMMLDIKDGSGSISIEDVNNSIELDDGSGSISIANISGDIDIEDGSGSLTIQKVKGNLSIDDGSGSIDIDQISGTVKIDDGSGSMDIYDVGGLVTIDDGSGGITVKQLRNGLTILEEGSGGLKMSDIEGPVSIK
jgi:hypothetical protein